MKKIFEDLCPRIPPHVIQPVELKAKYLFVSHYIFEEETQWSYVKAFHPLNDDHLTQTLKAVFLAYYSQEVQSEEVLQEARKAYSTALKLTSQALESQDTASKNTTLLTTFFLHLFENLTSDKPIAVGKHLEGALILLKFRGFNQFHDPLSLMLFKHLSSILISGYLACGLELPNDFLRLRKKAAHFACTEEAEWRLDDIMIRLSSLQISLKHEKSSKIESLAPVQTLDLEFKRFCQELPQFSESEKGSDLPPLKGVKSRRPNRRAEMVTNLKLVRRILDSTLRENMC